jgi:hypothetical protein
MDNCVCGINYFGNDTIVTKLIVFYVNHFVIFFILQQEAILVFVTKYIEDNLDNTAEIEVEEIHLKND